MKLITDVKLAAESQPDPYILAANGKFYIYATSGNGVALYRSDNLFGGYEKLGENRRIRTGRKSCEGCVGMPGSVPD